MRVAVVEDDHVCKDNDGTIGEGTDEPEVTITTILIGWVSETEEGYVEHECWLGEAIHDPLPEQPGAEALVLKSNLIELGLLHELVFLVLSIEESEDHYWESCEDDVVNLEDPLFVEDLSWESWVETEPELGHHEENVLVEGVGNEVGVSSVRFSAVDEKEVLEVLELSNSIIWSWNSLLTFNSTNTNTNMCSCDHVNIISSISNGEGNGSWVIFLY